VAIGFTMEDNQGLEEEVLRGGGPCCMGGCRAHQELPQRSYAHELNRRGCNSYSHSGEGEGYNSPHGPIAGSLQVLEAVLGIVSVGSFRDQLTSSTSGKIAWAFVVLWGAGRRSDARARRITVDGVDVSS